MIIATDDDGEDVIDGINDVFILFSPLEAFTDGGDGATCVGMVDPMVVVLQGS